MQELMPIGYSPFGDDQEPTVNARDVWTWLETKTPFTMWIERRVKDAQLVEGKDYIIFSQFCEKTQDGRGRPSKEYHLTFDAAKKVVMLEGRNDKAAELRQYFIDFEKKAKKALLTLAAQGHPTTHLLPLLEQQAISIADAWMKAASLFAVPAHIAQVEAVKAARAKTGVDFAPLLLTSSVQDNIKEEEKMLEPANLGLKLGITGNEIQRGKVVNAFLEYIGWQVRQGREWVAIGEGKKHSASHQWTRGNCAGYNIKWNVEAVTYQWEKVHAGQGGFGPEIETDSFGNVAD